jgi:hypothetical protein
MRFKNIAILATSLLTIGFGSLLAAGPSFAQGGGDQFCTGTNYCINAWNGGPLINVYAPGVNNNAFTMIQNSSGYWNLQFTNTNSNNYGECIGDMNDSSTNARAALDPQDCASNDIAWGANFTIVTRNCPSGEFALHNNHWNGYLAPSTPGLGNGDSFYLNNADEFCYSETFFVGQ